MNALSVYSYIIYIPRLCDVLGNMQQLHYYLTPGTERDIGSESIDEEGKQLMVPLTMGR